MGPRRVLLAAAIAGVVTAMVGGSVAADAGGPAAPLVEAPSCARAMPPPPPPADLPAGSTFVSFAVPNQVRLRVDAGVVVAAATNTGCAPRPDDQFLVAMAGDAPVPATAEEVALSLASFRTGDWRRPGVWHDPSPG